MAELQTYVYDGVEVKKTGRVAKRQIPAKTVRSTRQITGQVELVEIKPIDELADWKKWVRETDLYLVDNNDN
jgi:hypothetical protein